MVAFTQEQREEAKRRFLVKESQFLKDCEDYTKKTYLSIPKLHKPLFLAIFTGEKSKAKCIKAKCLECSNFEREEIQKCPIKRCPLYSIRPYQKN